MTSKIDEAGEWLEFGLTSVVIDALSCLGPGSACTVDKRLLVIAHFVTIMNVVAGRFKRYRYLKYIDRHEALDIYNYIGNIIL